MQRRKLLSGFASCTLALPLAACGGGSGPSGSTMPAAAPPASPAASDWASVIDGVVDTLQTAHIQPWRRVSQEVFLAQANSLKARINALPSQLAAVEAMALVATVGDGHTSLSTWALHRWLGVGLSEFSDGIFISTTTAPLQHFLGAQVIQIGGLSAEQALAAASKLWPAENPSAELAWGQWLATSINALRWMGATDNLGAANLTVRRVGASSTEIITVQADQTSRIGPDFNPSDVALRHREYQQAGVPYWSEWIESTRSMYFRYRECRDATRFVAFSEQLFSQIDARPVRRLIVDLRGNRGGDSAVWQPFLQGLSARATQANLAQAGALRVLTDRYTFSAAVDATLDLLQSQAVHIGEAPGQSPNFLGNVVTRVLTGLNVGMQYPTRTSNRVAGNPSNIVPAVALLRKSSDYFGGRDPALARAMQG